jgi:hypothetical protein
MVVFGDITAEGVDLERESGGCCICVLFDLERHSNFMIFHVSEVHHVKLLHS